MDVQAWTAVNWVVAAVVIQMIYGLILHHHSMMQVRAYNNKDVKQVEVEACVAFFFVRVFLSIPLRLIGLAAGIISVIIIPISRTIVGLPALSHDTREWIKSCFDLATRWHVDPKDMSDWSPNV